MAVKTVFTPIAMLARGGALSLSQAALAQLLGVTHLTLHRWERGQRAPGDPGHVEESDVLLSGVMLLRQNGVRKTKGNW